ncbi:hypothetical protein HDU78_010019 [Chytriomyces hyalinus]|nr:hypothetical protein HDU78_010019 [Chytriomyces hyalinus]
MTASGIDMGASTAKEISNAKKTLAWMKGKGFNGFSFRNLHSLYMYPVFIRSQLKYGLANFQNTCLCILFSVPTTTSIASLHLISSVPTIKTPNLILNASYFHCLHQSVILHFTLTAKALNVITDHIPPRSSKPFQEQPAFYQPPTSQPKSSTSGTTKTSLSFKPSQQQEQHSGYSAAYATIKRAGNAVILSRASTELTVVESDPTCKPLSISNSDRLWISQHSAPLLLMKPSSNWISNPQMQQKSGRYIQQSTKPILSAAASDASMAMLQQELDAVFSDYEGPRNIRTQATAIISAAFNPSNFQPPPRAPRGNPNAPARGHGGRPRGRGGRPHRGGG